MIGVMTDANTTTATESVTPEEAQRAAARAAAAAWAGFSVRARAWPRACLRSCVVCKYVGYKPTDCRSSASSTPASFASSFNKRSMATRIKVFSVMRSPRLRRSLFSRRLAAVSRPY